MNYTYTQSKQNYIMDFHLMLLVCSSLLLVTATTGSLPNTCPNRLFLPNTPFHAGICAEKMIGTSKIQDVIHQAPNFNGYSLGKDASVKLTDLYTRPANLFFEALGLETTMPGSGELFKFVYPPDQVRDFIWKEKPERVISVTAKDRKGKIEGKEAVNLEDYLGRNTYRLSFGEIRAILKSQKIYVSPLLPRKFYLALKKAMYRDNVCMLPGHDHYPVTLRDLQEDTDYPNVQDLLNGATGSGFVAKMRRAAYGFVSNEKMLSFDALSSLSIYQIGSMVVKTEDYHCFVGDGYKISERNVGDKDEIHLISACGIRGFHKSTQIEGNGKHEIDKLIMKETFKTAMQSIGDGGYFVLPAIGMGVWRGTPEIYWSSFFDAVIESKVKLAAILVSPGHQTTQTGDYRGYHGQEFGLMLSEYKKCFPENENLLRVQDLYHQNADVLLLAKKLKEHFPDRVVGLLNASDPDVTLGYHVGEYINSISHHATTEENYGAAGSSCLNFEKITHVLENSKRVIQSA